MANETVTFDLATVFLEPVDGVKPLVELIPRTKRPVQVTHYASSYPMLGFESKTFLSRLLPTMAFHLTTQLLPMQNKLRLQLNF